MSSIRPPHRSPRLAPIPPHRLSDEQRQLFDHIVATRAAVIDGLSDREGALTGPFNAYLHAPRVGELLSELGDRLRRETSLDRRLAELVICTVAAHWRSDYELWAHAGPAELAGVPASVIESLRAGSIPDLAGEDRLVYQLTRELLAGRPIDEATFRESAGRLGERGLVELAALIGYYGTVAIVLNLFEIPPPDGE